MKSILSILGIAALGVVAVLVFKSDTAPTPLAPISEVPAPQNDTWEMSSDSAEGITFKYPEMLPTTYTHVVDWPPQARLIAEPYSCTEAGEPSARAGETMTHMINGREYCVTKVTEGAAGSTYTQYAYATKRGDSTLILTFTLRSPQCGNYPEPQAEECTQEGEDFNLDSLVDQIVQTVQ